MHTNWSYKTALIAQNKQKPGMRGRIDAKCIECIYDPAAPGNWRQQTESCAVTGCPLWEVRPKSSAQKD